MFVFIRAYTRNVQIPPQGNCVFHDLWTVVSATQKGEVPKHVWNRSTALATRTMQMRKSLSGLQTVLKDLSLQDFPSSS